MTELFAGRYAFVDLLGSGGMGTVWRVWDARHHAYTAAKMLSRSDSTSLLRFIRETSWRVEHDHVLTPTGWAAEDDRVLFTMPLLRGGTVGDLVRDFGALPDPLAADLLRQLLEALAAVHSAGLVHRDVKPSNLLLDPPGAAAPHLYLSDFGIAARIDDPRLTRMGEAVGTAGYTAPEVLRGADPASAQDLFAAGVVAVELLTGRRPAHLERASAAMLGDHPLRPLVDRLLADRPEDRPTAEAALLLLAEVRPSAPVGDDEVEVFDQVPALPEGWDADGPVREVAAPGSPAPVAPPREEQLPRTRTAPTAIAPATATTAVSAFAPQHRPGERAQHAPDTTTRLPAARAPGRRSAVPLIVAAALLVVGAASIWIGVVLLS